MTMALSWCMFHSHSCCYDLWPLPSFKQSLPILQLFINLLFDVLRSINHVTYQTGQNNGNRQQTTDTDCLTSSAHARTSTCWVSCTNNFCCVSSSSTVHRFQATCSDRGISVRGARSQERAGLLSESGAVLINYADQSVHETKTRHLVTACWWTGHSCGKCHRTKKYALTLNIHRFGN